MPYRRQIVAVSKCRGVFCLRRPIDSGFSSVGRPIHVTKCDKPSLEDVIEVQKLYIDELTRYVISIFSVWMK